jgi:hypothetical protein
MPQHRWVVRNWFELSEQTQRWFERGSQASGITLATRTRDGILIDVFIPDPDRASGGWEEDHQ